MGATTNVEVELIVDVREQVEIPAEIASANNLHDPPGGGRFLVEINPRILAAGRGGIQG